MQYENWIERERQFRWKILQSSPRVRNNNTYLICQECGELCLCHEEKCPNCNSIDILEQQLGEISKEALKKTRIRCKYRYNQLF